MAESNTVEQTPPSAPSKKKGLPLVAVIAIGCFGLLMVIGIVITIAGKILFSKIGANLVKKGIETKTGIKVDTGSKDGSFSITDSKTGEGVKVGEASIPSDFPKDFPLYAGAKPSGSLSGTDKNKGKGFWLVLTTSDSLKKVTDYYSSTLPTKGWTIEQTLNIADSMTMTISNNTLSGTLIISRGKDDKATSMVIALEPKTEKNSE